MSTLPGSHILVIDDEEAISELFTDFFETQGGVILRSVDSGEAALAAVREGQYSLIFCDLRMPGLSGPDLVRQLHEQAPDSSVVVMTGALQDEEVEAAMAQGAVSALFKPFRLGEIQDICKTYLHHPV